MAPRSRPLIACAVSVAAAAAVALAALMAPVAAAGLRHAPTPDAGNVSRPLELGGTTFLELRRSFTSVFTAQARSTWQYVTTVCQPSGMGLQVMTVTAQALAADAIINVGEAATSTADATPAAGRTDGPVTFAELAAAGPDGCVALFLSVPRGASDGRRTLPSVDVSATVSIRGLIARPTEDEQPSGAGAAALDPDDDDDSGPKAVLEPQSGAMVLFKEDRASDAPLASAIRLLTEGAYEAGRTVVEVLMSSTSHPCHRMSPPSGNTLTIVGATDAAGNALGGGCGSGVVHCCRATFEIGCATPFVDIITETFVSDPDAALSVTVTAGTSAPGAPGLSPIPVVPQHIYWGSPARTFSLDEQLAMRVAVPSGMAVSGLTASMVLDSVDPTGQPSFSRFQLGRVTQLDGSAENCEVMRYGQTVGMCTVDGPQPTVDIEASPVAGVTTDIFAYALASGTVDAVAPLVAAGGAANVSAPDEPAQTIPRGKLEALNTLPVVLVGEATLTIDYFDQRSATFRGKLGTVLPTTPVTVAVYSDADVGLSFNVFASGWRSMGGDGSRYPDGLRHIPAFPGNEIVVSVSAYPGITATGGAIETSTIRVVVLEGGWGAS